MKSGWPGVSMMLTVVAVSGERDDRGSDRDPALTFERQRVGLRGALVDAPDRVDGAGFVEQALGEGGLTGVYMRQDPRFNVSNCSVPLGRQLRSGWTRTVGACAPGSNGRGQA